LVVPQKPFEVPGRQMLLTSQQPLQLLGPQAVAQAWFEQTWPLEHKEHAAPPAPQSALIEPVWQVPLASQQPLVQGLFDPGPHVGAGAVGKAQAPLVQLSFAGQLLQVAPPVPQAAIAVPAWQTPCGSQQPFKHGFEVPGPHAHESAQNGGSPRLAPGQSC
jgi:hypothetical protein